MRQAVPVRDLRQKRPDAAPCARQQYPHPMRLSGLARYPEKNRWACAPLPHSLPTVYMALIDRLIHRKAPRRACNSETWPVSAAQCRRRGPCSDDGRTPGKRTPRKQMDDHDSASNSEVFHQLSTTYPGHFHRLTHMHGQRHPRAEGVIPTCPHLSPRYAALIRRLTHRLVHIPGINTWLAARPWQET